MQRVEGDGRGRAECSGGRVMAAGGRNAAGGGGWPRAGGPLCRGADAATSPPSGARWMLWGLARIGDSVEGGKLPRMRDGSRKSEAETPILPPLDFHPPSNT